MSCARQRKILSLMTGGELRNIGGELVLDPQGGEYEAAPTQDEWFRQQVWKDQPDEARAREGLNRAFQFFGMLGEGGGAIPGF